MKILAINPGSTSTKIAVFEDKQCLMEVDIAHSRDELKQYKNITDQLDMRKQLVVEALREHGIAMTFDAVVGRGGLSRAVESGVYEVDEQMVHNALTAVHQHACDLGCIIAREIALMIPGCACYIADPGVVDEMAPEAHVSGQPDMPRICIWHALNQKAIARGFAQEHGKRYEDLDLIMCHLGGGISIAAHQHGRAIDANNALDGEGPFSPERSGSLPFGDLVHLCYSGRYTESELIKLLTSQAGLTAHLGTNNMKLIEQRIKDGDAHAKVIVDAMLWHTAKAIVSEAAPLRGHVDAIILTGGLAHSKYVTEHLKERIDFLAPVFIYPGQNEMLALAQNALAVLRGEREAKVSAM